MTTNMNTEIANLLTEKIRHSEVGEENDFESEESYRMAEELLDNFLVMNKGDLPEANHMDTMIYVGDQAIPATSNPERILDKALAYLAAAAKLTEIQVELKAAKEKEMNELRDIINGLSGSADPKIKTWQEMTAGEVLAARELKRLRRFPLAG